MIRTKYVTTKSKECADNNKLLFSLDGGGDLSIFHMKDMKAIILYDDQVKALLQFFRTKKTDSGKERSKT